MTIKELFGTRLYPRPEKAGHQLVVTVVGHWEGLVSN